MATFSWDSGADKHLEEEAHDYLDHIASEILMDAKRYVPVDSGALLDDLDKEVTGLTAAIGAKTLEYSVYVELGTRPHMIRPTQAKALYWVGAPHPVKSVSHPGTAPHPYLAPALYKKRG